MAEQQCDETIYSITAWGSQCTNKGKVQEAGKWWCGIHSPEAKRKRKAKQTARWAENDARWAAKRIRHEEDERKLATYDALAESHAELLGVLEVQCVKAKWAWQFLAAIASDGHNREHAGRAVALVECPESPCPGWRADLQSYRDAIEDIEAALTEARKL